MRAFAGERNRAFTEARFAEVRELLDRAANLGPGINVTPLPVAHGYDGWAKTYDGEDNGRFPMRDDVLTPMLDDLTPGRALDAAYGTGAVAQQLVARGHDVVGIDISEAMLSRARKAVPDARFMAGDLTDLPLSDGDVDHVGCSLALTHLSNLRPFFAEAARVMRPRGHPLLLDTRGHFTGSTRYPLVKQSPDGRVGHMAGYSHSLGDYLRAALPHGYVVRACDETYRDDHTVEPDEMPEPLTPGPPGYLGAASVGAGCRQRGQGWPTRGRRVGSRTAARCLERGARCGVPWSTRHGRERARGVLCRRQNGFPVRDPLSG